MYLARAIQPSGGSKRLNYYYQSGAGMIAQLPVGQSYKEYIPRRKGAATESFFDSVKGSEGLLRASAINETQELSSDRLDMVETINNAARTISELVNRNEMLRQKADETIALLKNDLRSEKERSERLRNDLEALQVKHSNSLAGNEQRLRDLNAERQDLADRLQKVEEDLDVANQWLEYVSAHVRTQLSDTIRKAEQFLKVKQSST
jgi:DNA repair exonuclease SbcCD ATPase subunit